MSHAEPPYTPETPEPSEPPKALNIVIPVPTANADGSMTFDTEQGATITTNPDGSVSLDFKHIKSIGIHNIIDVQAHNVNTVLGMVSHFVKFHNGGELRFAYNQAGQLVEFSFTRLHVNITDGNRAMFSATEALG
jgi:hypothetical protein